MMEYDELRRLAIRLAKRLPGECPGNFECDECGTVVNGMLMDHTPDCPIAALEAEEAASVPVITLTGEGWTKVNMRWDGVQRPCWVQLGSIEVKYQ